MGKISPKRRQFEIKRKRKRRKKIKKLKEKYLKTKGKKEKEKIIEKMKRVSPHFPIEEFLEVKKHPPAGGKEK